MEEITRKLFSLQDERYRDFQIKLVPGITKEQMIGIRTPDLRALAKEIAATSETASAFLQELPHKYFEENLIHFFIVALIKDFDECINQVERFLPYVDCWPVCDQASPKVFKKNHEKLLPLVKNWISSDHIYTSRYGMRILMNEFLGEDFKTEYADLVVSRMSRKGEAEDYYLKMMAAWYFATALESFRVTDEHKEYLRILKV